MTTLARVLWNLLSGEVSGVKETDVKNLSARIPIFKVYRLIDF